MWPRDFFARAIGDVGEARGVVEATRQKLQSNPWKTRAMALAVASCFTTLVHANPGNPTVDFHGEKRSNQTHESTTDPDALLARKGAGKEAKLSYSGHVLMENRNGLVADAEVLQANGTAERDAALVMIEAIPGDHDVTVGADKNYDTKDFVAESRNLNATPHVSQNNKHRKSAIDGRTTRHAGYTISQQKRKRVEEIFGWMKTVGGMRKLRHRGLELVGWMFTFAAAAYNLVRIRNLATSVDGGKA